MQRQEIITYETISESLVRKDLDNFAFECKYLTFYTTILFILFAKSFNCRVLGGCLFLLDTLNNIHGRVHNFPPLSVQTHFSCLSFLFLSYQLVFTNQQKKNFLSTTTDKALCELPLTLMKVFQHPSSVLIKCHQISSTCLTSLRIKFVLVWSPNKLF